MRVPSRRDAMSPARRRTWRCAEVSPTVMRGARREDLDAPLALGEQVQHLDPVGVRERLADAARTGALRSSLAARTPAVRRSSVAVASPLSIARAYILTFVGITADCPDRRAPAAGQQGRHRREDPHHPQRAGLRQRALLQRPAPRDVARQERGRRAPGLPHGRRGDRGQAGPEDARRLLQPRADAQGLHRQGRSPSGPAAPAWTPAAWPTSRSSRASTARRWRS